MTEPRNYLAGYFPDLIFYNEPVLDSSILGVALASNNLEGADWCVAYSESEVLNQLVQYFDNQEEAIDWYDYNILGTWAGTTTPVFINEEHNEAFRFGDYEIFGLQDITTIEAAYKTVQEYQCILFVPMDEIDSIIDYL